MHPSQNNPNFACRERSADEKSPIIRVGEIPELCHSFFNQRNVQRRARKLKQMVHSKLNSQGLWRVEQKEQRGDLAVSLKTVSSAEWLESNYSLFHKTEELEETKRSWQVKVQNK